MYSLWVGISQSTSKETEAFIMVKCVCGRWIFWAMPTVIVYLKDPGFNEKNFSLVSWFNKKFVIFFQTNAR